MLQIKGRPLPLPRPLLPLPTPPPPLLPDEPVSQPLRLQGALTALEEEKGEEEEGEGEETKRR